MSDHKDMTSRHLRHKLQSLGRRLDELEEATKKLQKSEDELLDLQDKIIQAEGSNSSLLGDVEALRKRLLKIQGKDEEMRKAEDLCRTVREKLEEEENLTKELKTEIERLQQRMAELEKLEEAFGKSKSDCSQLCLSLNEEKNLTKKLSSEMEALKGRLKELEGSEVKLDRAEQALGVELEKLKGFTQAFVSERKRLQDKQREDERIILKLTEQLERQKTRLGTASDPSRADYMRSHIENELTSTGLLTGKLLGRKKSLEYLDYSLRNKSENEKNSFEGPPEEDNKVKELTMEVERLKNRLKQLEIVEEDLKTSESQNGELQEKFQQEQSRARQLSEQVEQLRMQLCANGGVGGTGTGNGDAHGNGAMNSPASILENGKAENEEINVRGGFRQEKPKYRSIAASEPNSPKHRNREVSPQHKREAKLRNKELNHSEESSPKTVRRALSPAHKIKRAPKATATPTVSDNGVRGTEEKTRGGLHSSVNASSFDSKKVSVLSRYPPAANDQKPWRAVQKSADVENKKSRVDKFSKLYMGSDSESNSSDVVPESAGTVNSVFSVEKDPAPASAQESLDRVQAAVAVPICSSILSKPNGAYEDYRPHVSPLLHSDQGSEGHSSSETESIGSRPSEPETVTEVAPTALSSRIPNPKYPRYSRGHDSHSEDSSTRSSFDEALHSRPLLAEGGPQEPLHSLSGIEVRRVFSPREALSSKAVIKPAIVEIDRKEVMMSEQLAANGKPKISTKPVVTSSITIYPNDPSSSRNSSRSSSISSEPMLTKERHTSTSNILIGPTSDHRGSISIPYEISIPKSDIAPRPCQDRESASNDAESCFESGGGTTTTVTSWRSQTYGRDDCSLPETRNVTVRSTWRNRGAAGAVSMDEMGGGGRAVAGQKAGGVDGGSDDEASTTTWRAYRATTVLDADEAASGLPGAAGNRGERGAKRSPVEAYMHNVNSIITSTRESQESRVRRTKSAQSPGADADLGCAVIHEPITSQSWGRSYTHSMAESTEPSPVPCQRSPSSWRRHAPGGSDAHPLERGSRVPAGNSSSSSRAEQWAPRGQSSSVGRAEGRSSLAGRLWNQRPSEHH